MLGVQKLDECECLVQQMKEELLQLQPVLAAKTAEIEAVMEEAERENTEAEKQRQVVLTDEVATRAKEQEAAKLQEMCREKLSVAEPQLKEAILLLRTLKISDFVEMKSLMKPPQIIRITMDAICILLGQKGTKKEGPNGDKVVDYWVIDLPLFEG